MQEGRSAHRRRQRIRKRNENSRNPESDHFSGGIGLAGMAPAHRIRNMPDVMMIVLYLYTHLYYNLFK